MLKQSLLRLQQYAVGVLLFLSSLGATATDVQQFVRPRSTDTANVWSAAAQGDLLSLDAMLKAGDKVDEADGNSMTPLMHALKNRQMGAVQALLKAGANPSTEKGAVFGPLAYAFWAGLPVEDVGTFDTQWLEILLSHGANVHTNVSLRRPILALVATAYPPQPEAVKLVLSYKPDVDQRYGLECMSALMDVVSMDTIHTKKRNEVVQLLLEAGANPNVTKITNTMIGELIYYPTPLLQFSNHHSYASIATAGELDTTSELINLLLAHGADYRHGGIGGARENHAQFGCQELAAGGPGFANEAGAVWSDIVGTSANTALTQVIGDAIANPLHFNQILRTATPIARGEIGYPALYSALAQYDSVLSRLFFELNKRDASMERLNRFQTLKNSIERNMLVLLQLGTSPNPNHVMFPSGSSWEELWITKKTSGERGVDILPLFEHRMDDQLYLAFLQAGANPAMRPDSVDILQPLLSHLINNDAATKLDMVRGHLGLLARVPRWCGKSVMDIANALSMPRQKRRDLPTETAAKAILFDLLLRPACSFGTAEQRRDAEIFLRNLGDPEVRNAVLASPVFSRPSMRKNTAFR